MKAKILVVDDEESIRFTFNHFLSEKGHQVFTAHNYDEAINVISKYNLDLIFTDVILDRKNSGIDLLRQVKKWNIACPVIIISGQPDIDTAADSVRLGAFNYLLKPIRQDSLLRVTEKTLKRTEAERKLEQFQKKLRLVMDNIPQYISWKNRDLVYTGCNKNFSEILGLRSPEDITGKTDSEILSAKKYTENYTGLIDQICHKVISNNKSELHKIYKINFRKKEYFVDASFVPMPNDSGKTAGVLCCYDDITAKVLAEKNEREMELKLMQSGKLAAMGEMAAGIAHEINQPLSIINIIADGLANQLSEDKSPDTSSNAFVLNKVQRMLKQVNRITNIIDNMRSFVQKKHDNSAEYIDLAEPIELALSFFKEQFRLHDILMILDLKKDVPLIWAEKQKFEQIVVNLLSNARYAVEQKAKLSNSEYHKKIEIRLFLDKNLNAPVFEVIDNGIGMNKETVKHCLEPFFSAREEEEGTGLGLSIVQNIAKEFKMKIEIESQGGETVFRIICPAIKTQ